MKTKFGTQLYPDDQEHVLRSYVYRFTREHKPDWARKPRKDGMPYPMQFGSDREWLENTRFAVRKDGRLDRRANYCESTSTWPDNPELRTKAA